MITHYEILENENKVYKKKIQDLGNKFKELQKAYSGLRLNKHKNFQTSTSLPPPRSPF